MIIEKNILTVSETACVLSCSTQCVYRLIRTNALRAYKDAAGRPWRIPESCIRDYVASRMNPPAPTK